MSRKQIEKAMVKHRKQINPYAFGQLHEVQNGLNWELDQYRQAKMSYQWKSAIHIIRIKHTTPDIIDDIDRKEKHSHLILSNIAKELAHGCTTSSRYIMPIQMYSMMVNKAFNSKKSDVSGLAELISVNSEFRKFSHILG